MTDFLTPAGWIQRPDLAALVAALGPGNARYVGGAVRDTLLGLPVADIDIEQMNFVVGRYQLSLRIE